MFLWGRRLGGFHAIGLISILFTAVMPGCANNPSLNSLYAGNIGAVANIDVARFGDDAATRTSPALEKPVVNAGIGDYDFIVEEVQFRELSFLSNGSQAPSVKIVAKNRGYAPISLTVTFDRDTSENMTADVIMPHTTVVPPQSEMVVTRFEPKNNRSKWKLSWSHTWSIGDYTTRHLCPEGYRIPFSDDARASATVSEESKSNPYTRHAVVFSSPAGENVVAVRKGTVVKIAKNNDMDILHDDSTIATYSHLGKISPGIRVGKTVTAGEVIGAAGKTMDQAYVQLAVWRPEPKAQTQMKGEILDFTAVSFPLEFCTAVGNCKVFERNQSTASAPVAQNSSTKTVATAAIGEYDFSVAHDKPEGSSGAPSNITAINRGFAPVSVSVNFDSILTENIRTDVSVPLTTVVPPLSETVLVRLFPSDERQPTRYSWVSSWRLGDMATSHHCPEHYRFPFADNVRAFASVADKRDSDPYTRHAVIFSMPAETKVLAVRRGIVVKINKNNDLDVLHDDATIATYNHLGKTDKGIFVGKAVSAGDTLGIAGKSENAGRSHIQITVWRPEKPSTDYLVKSASPRFQAVSFPLEFCFGQQVCKVLAQDQQILLKPSKKSKKH